MPVHGEPDDGPGVGEHVFDAVRRIVGVHRDERRTGLGDRPRRGHRLEGPGQCQCDHRLGPEAAGDQQPRQPVRVRVELPVAEFASLEHHRGGVGIDDSGRRQQLGQGPRRHPRAAAHRGDRGPLVRRQQVDVTQPDGGIGGDGAQDGTEPFGEAGHGRRIEQVGRVGESGCHPGRFTGLGELLGESELQIEVGGIGAGVDDGDRQARQLQSWLLVVAELEHHLEQRRVRGGTLRCQRIHEALERQVGVVERIEVAVADRGEQLRVGGGGIEVAPQHQCVDEHADHVVEGGRTAARDRCADRDVVGVAQSGQ
ncbi:hypothetical protein RE9416_24150 [Prescottella equi]|nr:hypothetical protein RE9416_24150 [Prescottella equi]